MTKQGFGGAHQIAALSLCCIGAAGAVMSWRMGLWTFGSPDAGLLPFVASVLLASLAGAAVFVAGPAQAPIDAEAWRRLASYGVAMLLLCVGPLVVGCLVGFMAALFVAMHFGERLSVKASLAWSAALAVGSVVVFRLVLGVPLPDPLIDRLLGF